MVMVALLELVDELAEYETVDAQLKPFIFAVPDDGLTLSQAASSEILYVVFASPPILKEPEPDPTLAEDVVHVTFLTHQRKTS